MNATGARFSPDILGCGSLGDALEDTRANIRGAIELCLNETAKAAEPIPDAVATSVDFKEFDPDQETKLYVVEWLSVELPVFQDAREFAAAD